MAAVPPVGLTPQLLDPVFTMVSEWREAFAAIKVCEAPVAEVIVRSVGVRPTGLVEVAVTVSVNGEQIAQVRRVP